MDYFIKKNNNSKLAMENLKPLNKINIKMNTIIIHIEGNKANNQLIEIFLTMISNNFCLLKFSSPN